ncbi:uncharacterized protein LOC122816124 [Protopterus annectens]|uniref:uncharacterized protein LOC122816124 n=1 Tax=Protopterus annectens TaxID=7888 RepID=UPI001CFB74E8|nr:uncharacterized protein LOC122816124 [Protopterus annectens]
MAEYATILNSHISVDGKFAHLTLQTGCISRHSVQLGFRHSIPLLQSLSIPRENKIKVEAGRHQGHKALIDITFGQCDVKVSAEAKNRNHGVDVVRSSKWSASLINDCPALKKVGISQNLGITGSFSLNKCNSVLNGSLTYDGKTVSILLETACDPQYSLTGSLQHSVPHLSDAGLPNENRIILSTARGPKTEGFLLLEFGKCTIRIVGDLRVENKTEWMWRNENECKLLQDFSIPAHSQFKGSLQTDTCKAEFGTTILLDANSATLEVKSLWHPELNAEISFHHNMSFLKSIPEENKISIRAGNQTNYELIFKLNSGNCILESSGDFQLENKLKWKLVVDNKCKQLQDYGIPLTANGSGHILLNQANLDSQIMVNVDAEKLKGTLAMRTTDTKQEMDASLSQNFQGALNLGIPANTVVDISSEKSDDLYQRLIRLKADNKQITEELSFIQKPNLIAVHYKLMHNIDTLRNLMIEDKTDIKIASSINGSSPNIEGSMQVQFGDMSLLCTVTCYLVGQRFELALKNSHNNERLRAAGFAKIIALSTLLEKQGLKIISSLKGRYDEKGLAIHANTSTGFEDGKPLVLNVNVEHSVPVFKKFGLPFSVQVDSSAGLNDSDFEGSLKLYYEPKTNLVAMLRARNQLSSKAFQYTVSQNIPLLLSYLPSTAEIATEVNYFTNKIESKLLTRLQQHEFQLSSTIAVMEFGYSEVFGLSHTFPQLTRVPKQLTSTSVYQKFNRTHILNHNMLWDGKETKFMGTYMGLFPKLFGSHELKVDLFHSFNIPLPHQLKLSTHLAHSTHSHQDDIIFGWNGRQQMRLCTTTNMTIISSAYQIVYLLIENEVVGCSHESMKLSQHRLMTIKKFIDIGILFLQDFHDSHLLTLLHESKY